MLKYWWRWGEERPGAEEKMNQKVNRESQHLSTHAHTHSLPHSLAASLSTIHPLSLSPPQPRQNMTFLIYPLADWSVVPPLPLCLPSSFIFNAAVRSHLELPFPVTLNPSLQTLHLSGGSYPLKAEPWKLSSLYLQIRNLSNQLKIVCTFSQRT